MPIKIRIRQIRWIRRIHWVRRIRQIRQVRQVRRIRRIRVLKIALIITIKISIFSAKLLTNPYLLQFNFIFLALIYYIQRSSNTQCM